MAESRILIVDFGGQYNQLIARCVRECGVYSEIHNYDEVNHTEHGAEFLGQACKHNRV